MKTIQLLGFKEIVINKEKIHLEEVQEEEYKQIDEILSNYNNYKKFKNKILRIKQIM